MKSLGIFISSFHFAIFLAPLAALHAGTIQVDRPNIVFVLTDDQRLDAAGFASGGAVWSPGMDKLRARGMHFNRAYAAYSLCSPSRAAILSGQYGSRNGVNALGGALNRPQDSFVNALRNAGYQTAVCGKWHLETTPKQAGFDWAVTFYSNGPWYLRGVNRNGVSVRPPELVDAYCAGESVRFLRDRDKTRPFILWHCSQLPHMDYKHTWPASEANLARYEKEKMPIPPTWQSNEAQKPEWLSQTRNRTQALKYGYKNSARIQNHTREYRATISDLDDALQPLWSALDAEDLWANTIVIFMSDNGWMIGEHGLTSKVLAYEPSARVPLFIAAPGIKSASQCDRLVSNLDIAPTLLDFAGLAVPDSYQGHSLRPLFTDPQMKVRYGFIYEGTGGYGEVPPMVAWITERTKVIQTLGSKPEIHPSFIEIYDLKNDPNEAKNLSSSPEFTEVREEGSSAFKKHMVAMTVFSNLLQAEPPSSSHEPVPLGKLDAFWRYSAGLGPFHERGQALCTVPDLLLTGSFPYRKRPFPKEVLFADHLSLVRILGGFNDGSDKGKADTAVYERDLAWRDDAGKIRYRFELLRPRLQPYLDNGYHDLTIVLDNVPWCFPEKPGNAHFGQRMPPRDTKEWHDFISAFCNELVTIMGRERASSLRFRVGTENGGRERFDGSHDDYIRHYDATAAAVRGVIPEAKVGCYNIAGVSLKNVREKNNVRPIELAEHCFTEGKKPTPFDWVAYSRYFRPGDTALDHAGICNEVWDAFEQSVPELRGISREIHEFGVAPWGEVKQGVFASAEPGALGTALTCQMMLRLREVGIKRLWHWGVLDEVRGDKGQMSSLPIGNVWLMSVLDFMRDGESFLLPAPDSPTGTCHLALICRTVESDLFLASAYNPAIADHTASSVVFRLPEIWNGMSLEGARYMRLDPTTSIHDRIRRELGEAGHLGDEYIKQPERLGLVREMAKDGAGKRLVAKNLEQYHQQWTESMTLRPLTDGIAVMGKDEETTTLTITMTPPELIVISIPRPKGQRN